MTTNRTYNNYLQLKNQEVYYNMASRFIDVAFMPDPTQNDPTSGLFLAIGNFTWDLNVCHFLGGQLPLTGKFSPNQAGIALGMNSLNSHEGILPNNGISNDAAQTSLKRPMNNCIWMLSTDDIQKSIAQSGSDEGIPK